MSTRLIDKIEQQIKTRIFSKTLSVYTVNKKQIKIKKFEYKDSKTWNPVSRKIWVPINIDDRYLSVYLKHQQGTIKEHEKLIGTRFILLVASFTTVLLAEVVVDLLKSEYNLRITKNFILEFEGVDKDFTRGIKKIKFFLTDAKKDRYHSSNYKKITIYKEFILRNYF